MPAPAPLPRFTLILPAGGSSTRFGSNKLLAMLGGQTVIARTLACFLDHPSLAKVIVATSQPQAIEQACVPLLEDAERRGLPPVEFAPGGATRAESVANAIGLAPPEVEWVAVHDAARPLLSRGLLDRTLSAALVHGAATPAMPITLTVKETVGTALPQAVIRTIPRKTLWAVQTPQIMRRTALADALVRCPIPLSEITDDLQLLELAHVACWLIPGEEVNLKLTTAADLSTALLYLAAADRPC
jgi:2-C-methyl-D-erythritol 4-phosphate cytidylyltransferase